jgi:hypothetical protein
VLLDDHAQDDSACMAPRVVVFDTVHSDLLGDTLGGAIVQVD